MLPTLKEHQKNIFYMNKIYLISIFFYFGCQVSSNNDKWINSLPKPANLTNEEFEVYLPQFQYKFPNYYDRIKAINKWRLNTPYGLFCLGEERGIDKDPLIRHDSSDCTVHILTTMAFAESSSYLEARNMIKKIHYKQNGKGVRNPSFNSRWHFTSDRILHHPKTIDITSKVANAESLETLDIELNKKENGDEFLDLNWTSKELIQFIPIEKINRGLLEKLPKSCGVAFVKRDYFKLGIVIAHEGFLIDNSRLFHASSEMGKTVEVDFLSYMKINKKYRFDGVMFYRLVEG